MQCPLGLLPFEMLPEGLIDDLGDSQVIEVSLSPDRLNPALLDVEGGALGLAASIAGLLQGGVFCISPRRGIFQQYDPLAKTNTSI